MSISCRRGLQPVFIESLERRMMLDGDPLPIAVQEVNYEPAAIIADRQRNVVYIADKKYGRIVAIDTDRARVVAATVLKGVPQGLAITLDNTRLFVTQPFKSQIEVLSLPDLKHIKLLRIRGESGAYESLAFGASNQLYAGTQYDFHQLDSQTGQLLSVMDRGQVAPQTSPDGNLLVSVDYAPGSVIAYDSSARGVPTEIGRYPLQGGITDLAIEPTRRRVYVSTNDPGGIAVIDVATGAIQTWPVHSNRTAFSIGLHPDVDHLYAVVPNVTSSVTAIREFRRDTGVFIADHLTSIDSLRAGMAMTSNGRAMFFGRSLANAKWTIAIVGGSSLNAVSFPTPIALLDTQQYSSHRFAFDAVRSKSGGHDLKVSKMLWRFGDGTHAYGMQTTHSYSQAGTYSVRLTVTNSGGATHDTHTTIRVGDTANTASISGTLFADGNANGVRDSSKEKALTTGYVWWDLDDNGQVGLEEPFKTVDSQGRFHLLNLAGSGVHKLRAALPEYVMTAVPDIQLAPGGEASNVNVPLAKGGIISSYLFNDINRNGRKDNFDVGAARRIWIDADGDGILDSNERSTFSNAQGLFTFSELTSGTYRLRAELLNGDLQIAPRPSRGLDVNVRLWQKSRLDYAIRAASNSSASGIVYNDTNGDGVRDTDDKPIANQTVFLDYNENDKLDAGEDSSVTNSRGHYSLPAYATSPLMTYWPLAIVLPSASWRHTGGRSVLATVGQTSTADVGITQTARIYGTAFFDSNGNGASDSGESGFGDVFVDLNDNRLLDEDEPQAEIGFLGSWSLPIGLDAGTYNVRLSLPADHYVVTTPRDGFYRVSLRAGQERKLDLGFVRRS